MPDRRVVFKNDQNGEVSVWSVTREWPALEGGADGLVEMEEVTGEVGVRRVAIVAASILKGSIYK